MTQDNPFTNWVVKVTTPSGKLISGIGYHTKEEAERAAAKERYEIFIARKERFRIVHVIPPHSSNPCIEKSFEATDEAGHKIRATIAIDDELRKFSICHTENEKDHICFTSIDSPDDQYQYMKDIFNAWKYPIREVVGESCLE